jgi:hypothetical protein
MKAKDIAAEILRSEDSREALSDAMQTLLYDAVALARQRKQAASQFAAFREAFQKWRAVCTELHAKTPQEYSPLDGYVGLFAKGLYLLDENLYVLCVTNKVLLSYELDNTDMARLQESGAKLVKAEREREEREHRAAVRQLFASAFFGTPSPKQLP